MTDGKNTLLALDVGNTHTVLGIFAGDDLLIRRRLTTKHARTPDEAWIMVKMLCSDGGVDPSTIDAVAISSVAPRTGRDFGEMVEQYLKLQPLFVHGEIPGFVNRYRNPRAVGADRVCASVAGLEKYGAPLLILDFGTAITIDVLDREGAYLGGVIMPGLEASASILKTSTALLPEARLSFPEHAIGTTTDYSIRSGLMFGAVHALRGMIAQVREEMGEPDAKVIATGGAARTLVPLLDEVTGFDQNLVLEGIRIIQRWSETW